jgi:hypothetical protein
MVWIQSETWDSFLWGTYPENLLKISCPSQMYFVPEIMCKGATLSQTVKSWYHMKPDILKGSSGFVVKVIASQPRIHGASTDRVTAMFVHMTPVLVGSWKRARKWLIQVARPCNVALRNMFKPKPNKFNLCTLVNIIKYSRIFTRGTSTCRFLNVSKLNGHLDFSAIDLYSI